MNRFIFSLVSVSVGFVIVVISAVSLGQDRISGEVYAQTSVATQSGLLEASASASEQALESVESSTVSYYLPYPGILPDHVLYPLKMLRDKLKLLLAQSPRQKAELTLLYADKRIGAAQVLVLGGKDQLGVDTAVKSQGYLSQSIIEAQKFDDQEFIDKLTNAVTKHAEILAGLKADIDTNDISRYEGVVETNSQLMQGLLNKRSEVSESQVETKDEASVEIEEISPAEFGR